MTKYKKPDMQQTKNRIKAFKKDRDRQLRDIFRLEEGVSYCSLGEVIRAIKMSVDSMQHYYLPFDESHFEDNSKFDEIMDFYDDSSYTALVYCPPLRKEVEGFLDDPTIESADDIFVDSSEKRKAKEILNIFESRIEHLKSEEEREIKQYNALREQIIKELKEEK